ncbi:hypothetical protein PV728_29390 [Streptomyces europaeiscabiei]|uniref:hypothetical protein n=1 Tax=Streptomyces europaeiscabiei TaxID=146819 RepID=UPI0029AB5BF6|nr:hypothetical protein [Streptomyces europaeiscabiei]MDX3634305.1 hypothetical protein [Streptomyces europaeiscabiei]MDX3651847.1 hypothetical protein [Streptomyces europaeiscabiei]
MTERTETRWNGGPCQARRITAVVADDGRFPQYWARHLVGTRRQVVEVTYGGETFYIDNEDGSGWNKVTHGGAPFWGHSSLTIEPNSIQPRVDPDKPCTHEDFDAVVGVARITASDDDPTVIGYAAEIKVNCQACGEPFRWTGVPAGLSPRQPMCSVDETTLHAPLRPASADPDFGLGLPGFSVNYRKDG